MPPTDVYTAAETSSNSSFGSPVSFQSEDEDSTGVTTQEDYIRIKMVTRVKHQEYENYFCNLWIQHAQAEQEKNIEAMRRYFESQKNNLHR